jgi:hypothetical protein
VASRSEAAAWSALEFTVYQHPRQWF